MAERFTEEEIEAFRNAFQLLDREEIGLVRFKSLGILLRSVGENPTDAKINDIINDLQDMNGYDSPRGSRFDFTDFLLVLSKLRYNEQDDIEYVFNVFDKEGTGVMRTGELRSVLHLLEDEVPEDDIDEMLGDFDLDGDGTIHFEEFAEVMGFNRKIQEEAASTSSTSGNGSEKKAESRQGSRTSTTIELEKAHTSSV